MKRKEKGLPMSRRANDDSPLRRILILFIAFNPVNRVQNGKDAIKRDHFRTTITEPLITITEPLTKQRACKAFDIKRT